MFRAHQRGARKKKRIDAVAYILTSLASTMGICTAVGGPAWEISSLLTRRQFRWYDDDKRKSLTREMRTTVSLKDKKVCRVWLVWQSAQQILHTKQSNITVLTLVLFYRLLYVSIHVWIIIREFLKYVDLYWIASVWFNTGIIFLKSVGFYIL
jgi:hypothetical protein